MRNCTERNKKKINANNQSRSLYSLLTQRNVTLRNRRHQIKAIKSVSTPLSPQPGGEVGGAGGRREGEGRYRVGCTLQRFALNTFLLREEISYSGALLHFPCGYDGLSQTEVLTTGRVYSGQHTSHTTQIICAASILNP